ncbi:B30.2/SPRY domain-containing protein [Entamoeba marina]
MKVALHFPTFQEIQNFSLVNKKCLDTLRALQVNPWFISNAHDVLFFQHFSPNTINSSTCRFDDTKEVYLAAERIRYILVENLEECQSDLMKTLPKVTALNLDYYYEGEQIDFIFNNATIFHNLQSLRGEIGDVYKFMKNYINDDKDKFFHIPKRITCFIYNNNVVNYLNWFKNNINFQTTQFIINLVDCWLTQDELNAVHNVKIYLDALMDQPKKYLNGIICDGGTVKIQDTLQLNQFNQIIENCYATKIILEIVFLFNDSYGEDKPLEKWDIPTCVQSLQLIKINEEVIDKYIEINLASVTKLHLELIGYIKLICDYSRIKRLTIENCFKVNFNDNSFENIEHIKILGTQDVKIYIGKKLKTLLMENSSLITIEGSCDELSHVSLINLYEIILPFFSFENKNVVISSCIKIQFKMNDSIDTHTSPLMYKNIQLETFNTIIKNFLCLPRDNLESKLIDTDVFYVQPFYTTSNTISIDNDEIINIKHSTKSKFNVLFSNNFYCYSNPFKYMYIYINEKDVKKVKSIIRYCEIEVFELCVISFGITSFGYKNRYNAIEKYS